jgi:hypothetical protein
MPTEWMRSDKVDETSNAAQQYLRRLNKQVVKARDEGHAKTECQLSFRLRSAMEQTCFWDGKSPFTLGTYKAWTKPCNKATPCNLLTTCNLLVTLSYKACYKARYKARYKAGCNLNLQGTLQGNLQGL